MYIFLGIEVKRSLISYEPDVMTAWDDLRNREKKLLSDKSVEICPALPEIIVSMAHFKHIFV